MNIWILSPRQRECLQLAACGFTNKEIGKHMGLKSSTVKNVVTTIYKKLDARCKIDAVFTGIQLGEISELHAYAYVEARQVANYLADNKQSDIQLPRQGHNFLITSSSKKFVPYS